MKKKALIETARGNRKLRFLDIHLGPTILRVARGLRTLASLSQPRFDLQEAFATDEARLRVGIFKLAGIGDLVLLSGVIKDICDRHPQCEIILFVGQQNAGYAKELSHVQKVAVVPITRPWAAINTVRRESIDVSVNFDSWSCWSALLSALSRAVYLMGFQTEGTKRHLADDFSVPHSSLCHEIENDRNLVRALQVQSTSLPLPLGPTWNAEATGPLVAIHLFASGIGAREREWPQQNWQNLMSQLPQDLRFAFTGSKQETERIQIFIQSLAPELRERCFLWTGLGWRELVFKLLSCRVVLSVDTGVAHLAAAQGLPTLTFFGPSTPDRWGPLGQRSHFLFYPEAGRALRSLGFENPPHLHSIESITVGSALEAVQMCLKDESELLENSETRA